jgi:cytochrome P450
MLPQPPALVPLAARPRAAGRRGGRATLRGRAGETTVSSLVFDPLAHRDDPYPIYRRLRDEAPVHHAVERDIWSVTRFDDVMHVLESPDVFSSRAMFTMLMAGGSEKLPPFEWNFLRFLWKMVWQARLNPLEFRTARNLIAEDGERHASLRAIVNRGFTPRRIAAWEERIRELVEQRSAPLRDGREFDVMRDLAVPVPVTIIAEMLGVPTERLSDFKRWSDLVVEVATGPARERPFEPKYADAFIELLGYVRRLARQRRAHPRDDLVSAIVAQQDGEAELTDREVVQFVLLLLVAGNETTTNLIGNVVNALLDHPDQAEKVAADPALVPALVEEGLRYDSPVQVVFRTTTRDTELRGVRIPAGRFVAVFLGSAHRDERRFPEPDRLDVSRRPQGFPGFGFGRHFCLGASLARLEARVVLEALVPELPKRVRAEERIARVDSFLVRGPKRLALRRAA